MGKAKIDKRILSIIRRQEQMFIRSISLVSVGIAILYISGFIWRSKYYQALGIPASMIEVNFPMVMIPSIHITVFLAQVILSFLGVNYYNFYKRERRARRAKIMGITEPLDLIVDFGLQKNVKLGRQKKNNQVVLYDFLHEYMARPEHKESDWKFDIKEFDKEALQLFPDIPTEIRESFVWYELQILCMDSDELRDAIQDSIGSYPEGSKLFERLNLWFCYGWLILIVSIGIFWSRTALQPLIYAALGVGIGFALAELSQREDRYQFWSMLWISVFLLFVLNAVDGRITARSDIANARLPIATVSTKNGEDEKGFLLASFSHGYFMAPLDPNETYRLIMIEKDEVRTIGFKRISSLIKSIENNDQYLKKLMQKDVDTLSEK